MPKFAWKSRVIAALTAMVAGASAWAQPPVTQDYGFIPVEGSPTTRTFALPLSTTVLWGKITIQNINALDGSYLDIHNGTDPVAPVLFDSEIAIFNSGGTLIAASDDEGGGRRSLLSFGDTRPRPALPSGGIPAGQNGASLASGVYYVAVTGYNKIFANGFSVTNGTPNSQSGNIALTVVANRLAPVSAPPATDLGFVLTNRLPITFGPVSVAGPTFYWTKFTLESGTSAAANYVDIHTNGSSITNNGFAVNDTEIAVYDAMGANIASSDDYTSTDANSNALSGLSFGRTSGPRTYGNLLNFAGQDGQLTPGTYYVAVGAYNLNPGAGFAVQQGNPSTIGAGLVRLNIETNIAKAIDYDLGPVLQFTSAASSPSLPIAAGQVRWVKFRSLAATDAANIFLDIHTFGSALPNNDTEIGLYTANGTLFRESDDWAGSPNNESGLSFGRTTGPRTYGTMAPFSGQSGAVLIPGEYYIAITTYDSSFAGGFVVNPGPLAGTVKVSVNTNAGAALSYNFGEVSKRAGTHVSSPIPLPLNTVRWFKFTTAEATSATSKFVNLHTDGSSLSSASITVRVDDTVLELYDRFGNPIAGNDDWGSQINTGGTVANDYRSGLSFGSTTPRSYGPVTGMAGQTAAVLPAGEYYVAVSGYVAGWNVAAPFTLNSNSTFQGAVRLNIITDVNATPCNPADVAGQGGTPGADGILTVDDVIVYLSAFLNGNLSVADIAQLGGIAGADGQLTADDLIFFLQRYFAGCLVF